MRKQTVLVDYYARTDCFGRLFFDKCRTDEAHLLNAEVAPGDDRPRCRVYADELLPTDALGKRSSYSISFQVNLPKPAENAKLAGSVVNQIAADEGEG